MTYSELEKKLTEAGCYQNHEGSRHEIWYSPITRKYFSVGRHKTKEVAKGTLSRILKDAGLK